MGRNNMSNSKFVPLLLKAIQKAKSQFDDYNQFRYTEMLKRAQHGHAATKAEISDVQFYLTGGI
jgi:hypothetical protein